MVSEEATHRKNGSSRIDASSESWPDVHQTLKTNRHVTHVNIYAPIQVCLDTNPYEESASI